MVLVCRLKRAPGADDIQSVENGPTQNYGDAQTWHAHPALATALRTVITLAPFVLSIGFGFAARHWLPPARLGISRWLWMALVLSASWGLLALLDRVFRRLIPLTVLLKLALTFPDQAPSRFSLALRTGSSAALQRRIDWIRSTGQAFTSVDRYAEQMLELVAALSLHDRLTRGHCERVRAYTDLLIAELKIPEEDANKLRWAALLHDIGKLLVPYEILNKKGRPTAEEWKAIQDHPANGARLVAPLAPWLGEWIAAVGQHHERWDGRGYPAKLQGKDIHIGARIVSVADTYDVITSARSYKKPMSPQAARAELTRCAGTQFDPKIVRAFLGISIGRLRLVSGPLSLIASLPPLRSMPVADAVNTIGTVAVATVTAVSAAAGVASPAAAEPAQKAAPRHHAKARPHHKAARHPAPARAPKAAPARTAHKAAAPAPRHKPARPPATTAVVPLETPRPAPVEKRQDPTVEPAGDTGCALATSGAPLAGAVLSDCDLHGVHLSGDLHGIRLDGADLTGAVIESMTLAGADLRGARMLGATVRNGSLDSADLAGADLDGATLSDVSLDHADFRGANLAGAQISGTTFTATPLRGVKLSGARITRVSFSEADLTGATGTPASVTGTSWTGSTCPDGEPAAPSCF